MRLRATPGASYNCLRSFRAKTGRFGGRQPSKIKPFWLVSATFVADTSQTAAPALHIKVHIRLQAARGEQAAELLQAQAYARLDRAERAVELGGDLLVRHAAEVG